MLSNCNRNCQGQTLCLNWLMFLPCTVCTYWDRGLLRKLDKKRSSPIIVLLYLRWYCGCKPRSTNQKLSFWATATPWYALLSHLNNRYEPFIDRHLIYRHRVNCCINCVLIFYSTIAVNVNVIIRQVLSKRNKSDVVFV